MSGKSLKPGKTSKKISYSQLDFNWHLSPHAQKILKSGVEEIAPSTTGRRSPDDPTFDRLFVPLASEPFDWFSSGKKRWELRKLGRQYTAKHVRIGRCVELRRGYSSKDTLWGEIVGVVQADNVEDFFSKVPFYEVIPTATSLVEAIAKARAILNVDTDTQMLGFAVNVADD